MLTRRVLLSDMVMALTAAGCSRSEPVPSDSGAESRRSRQTRGQQHLDTAAQRVVLLHAGGS